MDRRMGILRTVALAGLAAVSGAAGESYFSPNHQVAGIGVARADLSVETLEARVDAMVKSQTFAIMREAQALPGAKRISAPRLQATFRKAAEASGLPVSLLESIAYLESWGDPKAESGSGPRGIMQIAEATAKRIGLKVVRATRYRTTTEKVAVRKRGKTTYRTVRRKTAYKVTVRDDRLVPERAIPAAARYLAGMERRFGSRDWAVFAYHCGEGCVAEMIDLTRQARGIPAGEVNVARMFFSCSPAWNRDLYDAIRRQMERDYSPTYWFRVRRAGELLALYRSDPAGFARLAAEYRSENSNGRAPHRLSVWLRREDLVFQTAEDLRSETAHRLVRLPERPELFGVLPGPGLSADESQASPAAVGALVYIAWETRRLHEALQRGGEEFRPLEAAAMVAAAEGAVGRPEALAHASGEVIDVRLIGLPPGELECLRFVLSDLGWEGYLGFVDDGPDALHIGSSPAARTFFSAVYEEAAEAAR